MKRDLTLLRRGWLIALPTLAALACAPLANAQTDWDDYEYERDEGLHQQEWYDPSDWFDAEDGIDYESDYGDQYWYGSDYYWYPDDWYDDDYYDYGYYGDQGYDYGYNYNYGRDRDMNQRQGWNRNTQDRGQQYSDQRYNRQRSGWNENQDWNRRQQQRRDDWRYGQTNRQNQDWQQQNRYRSPQQYGQRDDWQRNQRSQQDWQRQQRMGGQQQPRFMQTADRSFRVQGEIHKLETVQLFEQPHLIAKIKKDNGHVCTVVLGPKRSLNELNLSEGDRVRLTGQPTVLSANRVWSDGQQVTVQTFGEPEGAQTTRFGTRTSGTVKQVTRRTIDQETHLIAELEGEDTWENRIDLGPEDRVERLNLQSGSHLTAWGQRGHVSGKATLIADRVQANGQRIVINSGMDREYRYAGGEDYYSQDQNRRYRNGDRYQREYDQRDQQRGFGDYDQQRLNREQNRQYGDEFNQQDRQQQRGQQENRQQSQRQSQMRQQQFTGDVQRTTTRSQDGQQHLIAVVDLEDGETIEVDLGPKDKLDANIGSGDTLTISGQKTRKDGKDCIEANSVQVNNGRRINIQSSRQQQSQMGQQQFTGEVQRTSTRSKDGKQCLIAHVELQNGETVEVDLGPKDELDANVSSGDTLKISGKKTRKEGKECIEASSIQVNNGRWMSVQSDRSGQGFRDR